MKWEHCKITFINRKFEINYTLRKSQNQEEIYEYDPKTQELNPVLREKMKPPAHINVEETPEPISESASPVKSKRNKQSRFADSDDSEEEESEEESEEYEEDDDIPSRTTSVSPIDDLVTKIEKILFKMKIPRCVKSWKETFNHLIPKTELKAITYNDNTNNSNSNSKQEMDVDEDNETMEATTNNPNETTPTIDEKQNDRDMEEDKENVRR